MIPLIGVLPNVDGEKKSKIENTYIRAIEASGGAAILLPYTANPESIDRFIDLCDGFIFAGGADIEPARYGEEKHPLCGETTPYRDQVEFLAFEKIMKTEKPIMGICRGSQLINVALGGTLYQDLPEEFRTERTLDHHMTPPYDRTVHEVLLEKKAPLQNWDRSKEIQYNDTISQCQYAKGILARCSYHIIVFSHKCFVFVGRRDIADTLLVGIYNMPFRGLAKVTAGTINKKMVDRILMMVNGHLINGASKFIRERNNKGFI